MELKERIEDFAVKKRHRLFERISLFATLMGAFHFFQDLSEADRLIPMIDLLITVVLFLCYLLHRKGLYNLSRIIALSFLNVCFAIYACVIPAGIGVYLFYFPLITISMAIFDPAEKLMRNCFVLLSAGLLILLFLTDFNLIGTYELTVQNGDTDFLINLISSTFILILSTRFILRVNEESEKRLHTLAEEVRAKNINLEKTNAELDRFFYSTSHDLRSPLLSIKGLINIAINETGDGQILKYLNMMDSRVDKLDLFIKDIIDYSKNARTEIKHEDVDMLSLVEGVKENLQFLDGAEKIQFETEIEVDRAVIDKTRLNIILNNLSSNAIKYHNHNGPNPWIKLRMHIADNHLAIGVSDNGHGISEESKSKIFDMFYRGTERSNGSGLGLYIVKEAVDKMKGSICVDSEEGIGSSFSVQLPLSVLSIA